MEILHPRGGESEVSRRVPWRDVYRLLLERAREMERGMTYYYFTKKEEEESGKEGNDGS